MNQRGKEILWINKRFLFDSFPSKVNKSKWEPFEYDITCGFKGDLKRNIANSKRKNIAN